MPENKDRKRLVRARMQKTGESYVTASRMLTRMHRANAAPVAPTKSAPTTADHQRLAGMSDAALTARTGRGWAAWCELIDRSGGAEKTHARIAAELHAHHGMSRWWSQTITVGYERIRGRRTVNQTTRGFAVSKSRTFVVPVDRLVHAFRPGTRVEWLGDEVAAPRRSKNRTVVRWKADDGAFVDVQLLAKGTAKTTVTIAVTRLADRAAVERQRLRWARRLQALADWLASQRDAGSAPQSREHRGRRGGTAARPA